MDRTAPAAPDPSLVLADVRRALAEDLGTGDVTAALLPDVPERAYLLCKEDAVIAGRPWFDACHRALDPDVAIDWTQGPAAAFKAAMDDDFNTPGALAVLFDLANQVNRDRSAQDAGLLKALGSVLGVLQQAPKAFLQAGAGLDEAAIEAQIAARAAAKAGRDFAEADRIRKALAEQGIELKDSAAGTTWVRASKAGEQA